jgi:galactokinase
MPDPRRFWAPGRVNLIGEHTDTTDGLVLPAAIDRGVTLEVELGGDTIELMSDGAEDPVRLPADGSEPPTAGWGRYVAAVAFELDAAGRKPVGMRGHVRSDLPQGSGLSSSAALEVAVALALEAAGDMSLPPIELAALCRRAEHRAVGVPSGIMDQAASLLGEADHAVLLDCQTLAYRPVPLPPSVGILVVDSGVRRELSASGYRRRVLELHDALPALDGRRPADVEPDELGTLTAGLDPVAARRLRHVVTENARVREAEAALRDEDLERLGRIFAEGHRSLRNDFEVTIPELDTLVELSVSAGARAARMTGGGFGGSIVALVDAGHAEAVGRSVIEAYPRRHPGRRGEALVCRASGGAREL